MISYIYIITNKINNKSYIGKTNYVLKRFKEHLCHNSCIGNAIKKYGKENFIFQVIEQYSSEEEAYEAEKFFIEYLGTISPYGYNLDSGGIGGKILNEETKNKLSKWRKGKKYSDETRKKMSESRKGRIFSEESKRKMSINHKGFLGKKHSVETKKKISNSIKVIKDRRGR